MTHSTTGLPARMARVLITCLLCIGLWPASQAAPVLTADATAAGYSLSQFASRFPTFSCCGPLGIAFRTDGAVVVSDYPGNVRVFATDADGQTAGSAPVTQNYGAGNAVGLARIGNFLYMAQQSAGQVVKLNLDGSFNSVVVTGIPTATGVFASPTTGKLYVSDCCSGSGIWEVDVTANTKTQFKTGSYDGLSISADGSVIYAEIGATIRGYRLSDGVEVFNSGFISGVDGTELGSGTLAGLIFANTNFGEVWEISLADPTDKTLLVTGGSRGDFVTADPNNGSLLFTQSDDIWRLTPAAGGCIGSSCNQVPEPGSLPMVLLAIGVAGGLVRRRAAARLPR